MRHLLFYYGLIICHPVPDVFAKVDQVDCSRGIFMEYDAVTAVFYDKGQTRVRQQGHYFWVRKKSAHQGIIPDREPEVPVRIFRELEDPFKGLQFLPGVVGWTLGFCPD